MDREVLLITRVRTLNKGNQALSAAWLALIEQAFPGSAVRVLERRPRHLLQYTLADLSRARDPVAAFDALASKLASLAPGPALARAPAPTRILLDETIQTPRRLVWLRRRLNLRGNLARSGWYLDEYRRRLSAMQRAELVVVNPAGEFFPREPLAAFYHLLDAHVAQKLGRPTAIVNHTLDITDPTLRKLIPAVYRTLALVGFRDEKSVTSFRQMGGDVSNVRVTPDLALTTEVKAATRRRAGHVAIAINVPEAGASRYLDDWFDVFATLKSAGLSMVLVSNELPLDEPFYQRVVARFPGIRIEGAGLDYDRYGQLLGEFELVISSRMHTAVLGMLAGTPVVAVEGASFKITGLYQELGLAWPVIRPGMPGWTDQVCMRVNALRAVRDSASSEMLAKLASTRERILSTMVPQLQSAAARLDEAPASRSS